MRIIKFLKELPSFIEACWYASDSEWHMKFVVGGDLLSRKKILKEVDRFIERINIICNKNFDLKESKRYKRNKKPKTKA